MNDNTSNELVEIYKGSYFSKQKKSRAKKVIVFDLDETLGSFVDLEILWKLIKRYNQSKNNIFNDILDIYPEFRRYGIIPILTYLANKKKSGECHKLFVYTNNQAGMAWSKLIIDYFNHKISTEFNLFDKIINAFKINNIQIELDRTSHKKTYDDFIKCTLLPKNTTICYIDDVYYKDMKKERIYYIQPMKYNHNLSTHEIINRFIYSKHGVLLLNTLSVQNAFKIEFIEKCMQAGVFRIYSNPTKELLENDILVSQKIMYHIKEYFILTNKTNKTCKRRSVISHFTRKIRKF